MNVSMLSNHVFNWIILLQLICTKKAWITTLSAIKGFSFWGLSSSDPQLFFCSAKLNNFQKSNIQYRFVHECGQLNMFSNHACCCLFKTFASNMHRNEWFQVRFFKHFLGRDTPSSHPIPSPVFYQASPSIFKRYALSTRALLLILGSVVSFAVMLARMIWQYIMMK